MIQVLGEHGEVDMKIDDQSLPMNAQGPLFFSGAQGNGVLFDPSNLFAQFYRDDILLQVFI